MFFAEKEEKEFSEEIRKEIDKLESKIGKSMNQIKKIRILILK